MRASTHPRFQVLGRSAASRVRVLLLGLAFASLSWGSVVHGEDFVLAGEDGVTAEAQVETSAQGDHTLLVEVDLPEGTHIYARSEGGLEGFTFSPLEVAGVKYDLEAARVSAPIAWTDPDYGDTIAVFKKAIVVRVPVTVDPILVAEDTKLGLTLGFSACSAERCFMRRELDVVTAVPVQAPLPVPVPSPGEAPTAVVEVSVDPSTDASADSPDVVPALPPVPEVVRTADAVLDAEWPGGAKARADFVLSGTCVRVIVRPQPGHCLYLPGNEGVTPVGLTPVEAEGVIWGVPELPQGGICHEPVHLMIPVARRGDVQGVQVVVRWQVCAPGGACLPAHEETLSLTWPVAAPDAEGEVGLIAPVARIDAPPAYIAPRPFRQTLALLGPLVLAAMLGAGVVAFAVRRGVGPWLTHVQSLGLAAALALGMMGLIDLGFAPALLFALACLLGMGLWLRHALMAQAGKTVPGDWMLRGAVTALLFTTSAGAVLAVSKAPGAPAPLPRFESVASVGALSERLATSAQEGRPVVIALIDPSCTVCRQLDGLIGGDPSVRRELGKLVRLRVDVRGPEATSITTALGIPEGQAPYLLFLDRQGRIQRGAELATWQGRGTRAALLGRLQHVLEDAFGDGEGSELRWRAPQRMTASVVQSRPALARLTAGE